jgi:lipopolysaccharide assembly outer membrane protein LptD (OstA)
MQYWTEVGRARYAGKVQMLSEDQQLKAQVLEIFGGGERLEAQGTVWHLLPRSEARKAPSETDKSKKTGNASSAPIIIQSSSMKYLSAGNALAYSGGVTLHSGDLDLSSGSLNAMLDKEGKSVEHATASEKVLIRQGDRQCKGEVADWYVDPGKFIVVGSPAEVYDPGRGRSFARRLTSFSSDDRILLENPDNKLFNVK